MGSQGYIFRITEIVTMELELFHSIQKKNIFLSPGNMALKCNAMTHPESHDSCLLSSPIKGGVKCNELEAFIRQNFMPRPQMLTNVS